MAPNKFEKHIKKQLEEREIQPSSTAWNKLSEKLDELPQPQKKRGYFWYGIAASIIGILLIAFVFFNTNQQVDAGETELVETPIEKPIETLETPNILLEKKAEEVVVADKSTQIAEPVAVKNITKKEAPKVPNLSFVVEKSEIAVLEENRTTDLKDQVIQTKILEIVATVDSLEQNSETLTSIEVDDLLRTAQEELLREKLFNPNGSVDAMALLNDVEQELDKSFRDQIFESLKEGFLKVRTAVADRNK